MVLKFLQLRLWKIPLAPSIVRLTIEGVLVSQILWQTVLGEIEVTVTRASFATWFKNTRLLENKDGELLVAVPNIFAKRQLEDKFRDLVLQTLRKNAVKVRSIRYVIQAGDKPATELNQPLQAQSAPAAASNKSSLNTRYTFDNFVVGSSNELAYAACQAIAREPGVKYNPLFVYGGVGLGKTHLIQAVGNEIMRRNQSAKVEYVTSERFAGEFIASILKKRSFSHHYRNVDVLIVDDMQFIAGKEKTQEEFFHTFNALHQANKQIIISSDKPPKAIPTLEERLRSRFEWGMTADIGAPDYETRIAIIQTKANQANVNINSEVIEYLATHIQSNVRELEGALIKLLAHCEVRGINPSVDVVQQMINPVSQKHRHVTPRNIIDKTARYFNLSVEELIGPKRDKDIVEPRQIAMYLMRAELHLSFPQIAKQVGRKDHTTAIHSVDKIEQAISNNQYMRQRVYELKEKLYA